MGHSISAESAELFSNVDILFNFRTLGTSFDVHSGSVPLLVSSSLQTARIRVHNPLYDGRPVGTKEVVDFTWRVFTTLQLYTEAEKGLFVHNVTCLEVVNLIYQIPELRVGESNKVLKVHYTLAQPDAAGFLPKLSMLSELQNNIPKEYDFKVNYNTNDQLICRSDDLVANEINAKPSGLHDVAETASRIMNSPVFTQNLPRAAKAIASAVQS